MIHQIEKHEIMLYSHLNSKVIGGGCFVFFKCCSLQHIPVTMAVISVFHLCILPQCSYICVCVCMFCVCEKKKKLYILDHLIWRWTEYECGRMRVLLCGALSVSLFKIANYSHILYPLAWYCIHWANIADINRFYNVAGACARLTAFFLFIFTSIRDIPKSMYHRIAYFHSSATYTRLMLE